MSGYAKDEGICEAEAAAELEWWDLILDEAEDVHASASTSIRDDVEAGANPRELARMVFHLADLSTATRRRMRATIRAAIAALDRQAATRPAGGRRRLWLVDRDGERTPRRGRSAGGDAEPRRPTA